MAETEKQNYLDLVDTISWFFFDLLMIGYVEDKNGISFRIPGELNWKIFIEVYLNIIITNFCTFLSLNIAGSSFT